MLRIARSLLLLSGVGLAGCQCCACTESFGDLTDQISSRECQGEVLYHPGLDLTRIGRRDWCQCGINSWLCPCRCNRYGSSDCP